MRYQSLDEIVKYSGAYIRISIACKMDDKEAKHLDVLIAAYSFSARGSSASSGCPRPSSIDMNISEPDINCSLHIQFLFPLSTKSEAESTKSRP